MLLFIVCGCIGDTGVDGCVNISHDKQCICFGHSCPRSSPVNEATARKANKTPRNEETEAEQEAADMGFFRFLKNLFSCNFPSNNVSSIVKFDNAAEIIVLQNQLDKLTWKLMKNICSER